MKTTILTIAAFFALTLTLNAQIEKSSQVKFHSSIETGYEDRELTFDGNGLYTMNKAMFSTLNFSSDYKGITLYTNTKTFYKPIKEFYNSPKQIEFYIGLKYDYKRFEFSAEHLCSHSIDSDIFYDSYNKVSVKITIL